jgi:hypothetical protein
MISVKLETMVSVLNGLLGSNPNPDDPNEPHGPGTPVVRTAAVFVAARVIESVAGLHQIAKAMPRSETRSAFEGAIAKSISEFADDFCGTPPRIHWPIPWPGPNPWPWGPRPEPWRFGPTPEPWREDLTRLLKQPDRFDQVSAGLTFLNAAATLEDSALKESFQQAGAALVQTGFQER